MTNNLEEERKEGRKGKREGGHEIERVESNRGKEEDIKIHVKDFFMTF